MKMLALRLLLRRIQNSNRAIVRTLHNVEPHERGSWLEQSLLHRIDASTDWWITINESSSVPNGSQSSLIRHGDYREWFAEHQIGGEEPIPHRILFFGLLRPYKGLEDLVAAFKGVTTSEASLRIVGAPIDPELGNFVVQASHSDNRVTQLLEYVSDSVLTHEILSAELVVLPYRKMHNSGAALLALSLGRPVLVVRNDANEKLAAEVGHNWVYLFDELTSDEIEIALSTAKAIAAGDRPDLGLRTWEQASIHHRAAYAMALASKRETSARATLRATLIKTKS